jgi:hypothetical protein
MATLELGVAAVEWWSIMLGEDWLLLFTRILLV